MSAFDAAADTLFADSNFGVAATYTPVSGPARAVTVILYQDDPRGQPFSEFVEERELVDVRKSEMTGVTPRQGDLIAIGTDQYRVDAWPMPDRASGKPKTVPWYTMRVRRQ